MIPVCPVKRLKRRISDTVPEVTVYGQIALSGKEHVERHNQRHYSIYYGDVEEPEQQ
jgi:hypothetical protein